MVENSSVNSKDSRADLSNQVYEYFPPLTQEHKKRNRSHLNHTINDNINRRNQLFNFRDENENIDEINRKMGVSIKVKTPL